MTYWVNLAIIALGRSLDLLTTWYGTPTLALELNPIAKRVGWKGWIFINIIFCLTFALWFNPSLLIFIVSTLAAANNLSQLWIVHITREPKESKTFRKLMEKVDPKIGYISRISYGVAIGVIGAIIIYFVGLDVSETMTWIGFALIGYAFIICFYLYLYISKLKS